MPSLMNWTLPSPNTKWAPPECGLLNPEYGTGDMLPSGAIADLKFSGSPESQSPRCRAIPWGMLSQPTPAQIVSPPTYIPFTTAGLRRSPTKKELLSPSLKSLKRLRLFCEKAPPEVNVVGGVIQVTEPAVELGCTPRRSGMP